MRADQALLQDRDTTLQSIEERMRIEPLQRGHDEWLRQPMGTAEQKDATAWP